MSKKEKFPLYLSPEKKATLERRYTEDGSRSLTAFIENAIDFYLGYLSANSIANVKRTNGRLQFEQIARDTNGGGDDEWQD